MSDFIILGTDTDVGKTTVALLWFTAFADQYEYWKPMETGASDSERVAALCPQAIVHAPLLRLQTPVAPPLAARMEGARVSKGSVIAGACPRTYNGERSLVIESFGGPFSPLNDDELQLALIHALARPCLLVSSTKLGAIGRTLQCLRALQSDGVHPFAVILLGDPDPYASETIGQHGANVPVVSLKLPTDWTADGLRACVAGQSAQLEAIRGLTIDPASHGVYPLGTAPGHGTITTGINPVARPNCSANAMIAEDRRCIWHPYTPLLGVEEPLACIGAADEFLHLADGRKIIDGISSWWTILHGHRHPPLMQALVEATGRLDHVLFAGVTHPDAIELADLLLGTMPWTGGRVFYSDNGSTAVEVALKMAYQFWCHHGETRRTRFIGFEQGYHGDTFGAMAVGRDPLFFGRFEPLLFGADILPLDPAKLDAHLHEHAKETAAVILEPLVQGAGGMRMHTPQTLRQIVEITARHGVLFIADEVMTGGGRTGTLWAHQAADVVPDLLCAAKTLTGGVLPLAATLAAPKIVEAFTTADRTRTFFHGHSFTANPLACAVAVRNYRTLLGNPSDAPKRIERFWTQSLMSLKAHPRVKDLRIRGSIAAVEIDAGGGYLAEAGRTMRCVCLDRGVLLRPLGSVLYALPPYGASDDSLQRIADAMIAAVDAL